MQATLSEDHQLQFKSEGFQSQKLAHLPSYLSRGVLLALNGEPSFSGILVKEPTSQKQLAWLLRHQVEE